MGHSLGEYGALVAAGARVPGRARGRERPRAGDGGLSMDDNGAMAAVIAPPAGDRADRRTRRTAMSSSPTSTATRRPSSAAPRLRWSVCRAVPAAGLTAVRIPVSHAFHTASSRPPANRCATSCGDWTCSAGAADRRQRQRRVLPEHADVDAIVDILGRQVASPVQFVKGLHTLYDAGARVFVEVGPKKALHGFVEDVFAAQDDTLALFTNHPKLSDATAFNQALCGLYAAGLGSARRPHAVTPSSCPAPPSTNRGNDMDENVRRVGPKVCRNSSTRGRSIYAARQPPRPTSLRARRSSRSRWSSPVPRWACLASTGSSMTRTSAGSSTVSSSSTRSRTASARRWSTSTSPGWSSPSRASPAS